MSLDVALLFEAHQQDILGYVRRRLEGADPMLIEDIAGDVWERVVKAAPRYRDEGLPVVAWLRRIAANLLTDHYRQRGRRVTVHRFGDIRPAVTHVGTDGHAAQIDAQAAVPRALDALTAAQRSVVSARYFDGMKIREAALATGHTENGVKKLQDRALVNLRRALEAAA